MRLTLKISILLALFACLIVLPRCADAQDSQPTAVQIEPSFAEQNLLELDAKIQVLHSQIETQSINLERAETAENKTRIQTNLAQLQERMSDLKLRFDQIASGVDPRPLQQTKGDEKFDLTKELSTILSPVVNEFRRLTSRVRELDSLRTQAETLRAELERSLSARENIAQIISATSTPALRPSLEKLRQDWTNRIAETKAALSFTEGVLQQRVRERTPFGTSVENFLRVFFLSRGQNFLSAFLCGLLFWFIVKRIGGFLLTRGVFSHFGELVERVISLFVLLGAGVGGTFIFLAALFIFEDWLLLTISLLLIIGIFLASKQTIPRWWAQMLLLLNLGAVRKGERVIYKDIPWKVESINIFTVLRNPALDGGLLKLPIADIVGLRSRVCSANDPWFPSNISDWVILSDGVYGQVEMQSPEFVRIKQLGGSIKTYSVSAYLGLSPQNLSQGFRISVIFGIDYQHRPNAAAHFPEQIKAALKAKLNQDGYSKDVVDLKVEYAEAAASSLNLEIIVDFSGQVASQWSQLKRLLNKHILTAANELNINIPFPELTVHFPENCDKLTAQPS